jgi:hypothetical protein
MAPIKKRRKDQTQSLHTPPLLPLQPTRPEQLPPRPQAVRLHQSLLSTTPQPLGPQSVPPARLTGSQPSRSQFVSQHQPQSQQSTVLQPRSHQLPADNNLSMSLAAFDMRVGYYDGNQKSMAALGGDKDIDMEDVVAGDEEEVAAGDEEDEHFPQESQVPSDDFYEMPPPGQRGGEYDFDFDRPLQLASPLHRPGCLRVYPLIFY